ncbi:phosphonate C-P lyase system protein PhnG [uncultured Roseibium sp.]|uniref:phosphonate C-P lyase system protein PhnG n=1 Tax=uncultured Roseibium sp. TaxID=1936171 RepID=UPI003216AC0B
MADTPASPSASNQPPGLDRKAVMSVLASASAEDLETVYASLGTPPAFEMVRQPETGLVMVRGRMGGTGSPFNLGEVTVTRCVVRLESGEAGSSYCLGRHKQKALQAAVIDALWQRPDDRERIETEIVAPLAEIRTKADEDLKAETAATKVDFFTMVRGDN